jgi:signal transduction histidine kinase
MDAMPKGGDLTINGHLNADGASVKISIKDTGSGIPAADIPYIFDPFFTTKQEGFGVGLGLSTAYGIIERHQGAIDVESKKGAGTTFTITLPV